MSVGGDSRPIQFWGKVLLIVGFMLPTSIFTSTLLSGLWAENVDASLTVIVIAVSLLALNGFCIYLVVVNTRTKNSRSEKLLWRLPGIRRCPCY